MASITIERGGDSVTLSMGLTVTRSVGRPNSTIRSDPDDFPSYRDRRKAPRDEFEITAVLDSSADANTLENDIWRPALGTGTLTLNFDGLFGYESFDVFPPGARSLRIVERTAEKELYHVNPLTLRVID